MRTVFTLTEREVVEGLRCAGSMTTTRVFLYSVLVLIALATGFGSRVLYFEATAVALVLACLAYSIAKRSVIIPRRARILYEVNSEFRDEQFVEFDGVAKVLRFGNAKVAGAIKLSNVSHWRRSRYLLLLGMAHRGYLIIPHRLRSLSFDIEALVAALEKEVGRAS